MDKIWDVATQACKRTLRGHTGWISAISLIQTGNGRRGFSSGGLGPILISSSWDSTIRVWRLATTGATESLANNNEVVAPLMIINSGQGNALYCISVAPDELSFTVGCRQKQIQRWDIESGSLMRSLHGHAREVHALDDSDSTLVSGSGDGTAKVWDNRNSNNEACTMTLREHTDSVMTVQVTVYTCTVELFLKSMSMNFNGMIVSVRQGL